MYVQIAKCICANWNLYFPPKVGSPGRRRRWQPLFLVFGQGFALNLLHLSSPLSPPSTQLTTFLKFSLVKHINTVVLMSKCSNAISTLYVPLVAAIRMEGDGAFPPFNFPKPSWLRHRHIIIIATVSSSPHYLHHGHIMIIVVSPHLDKLSPQSSVLSR